MNAPRNKFKMANQCGTTHGLHRSPEHKAWQNLKQRCMNKRNPRFYVYGARGITVCERWMNSFENFYADMGSRPSPDHSIERIDNSQGYCKENCKWATRLEQRRNSRLIRMVERDGIVKPMWQWSQELGIPYRKFQGMARAGKDGFTRLPNPSLAKVREAAKSRP